MDKNYPFWMWSEACEMLTRAERLHQQLFQLAQAGTGHARWQPPVDVLETDEEVLIFIALPGVNPQEVQAAVEDGDLFVAGARVLPAAFRTAAIHRLELPQGRFERRIQLPPCHYGAIAWSMSDGCLLIRLEKLGAR